MLHVASCIGLPFKPNAAGTQGRAVHTHSTSTSTPLALRSLQFSGVCGMECGAFVAPGGCAGSTAEGQHPSKGWAGWPRLCVNFLLRMPTGLAVAAGMHQAPAAVGPCLAPLTHQCSRPGHPQRHPRPCRGSAEVSNNRGAAWWGRETCNCKPTGGLSASGQSVRQQYRETAAPQTLWYPVLCPFVRLNAQPCAAVHFVRILASCLLPVANCPRPAC